MYDDYFLIISVIVWIGMIYYIISVNYRSCGSLTKTERQECKWIGGQGEGGDWLTDRDGATGG